MSDWKELKRVQSANGLRRLLIEVASGGLFRFTEESYLTEDGYTFWTPTGQSGLYDSGAAAERAAELEIPWLRDQIAK